MTRRALCGDPASQTEGILRPFHWSASDTDETIRQAKERNAEYEEVCK